MAARARRLAQGLTVRADSDRLIAFAASLDAEADALERATPPAPQVTQIQMQVQQGPPEKDEKSQP